MISKDILVLFTAIFATMLFKVIVVKMLRKMRQTH
jgi:hypothetical protein